MLSATQTNTMHLKQKPELHDIEERIMSCWSVVEDIKLLNEQMLDVRPMTQDEISNYLMGLETIYQVKFERLFAVYEALIHQNVGRIDNANPNA
jgi:hypothetical protein